MRIMSGLSATYNNGGTFIIETTAIRSALHLPAL